MGIELASQYINCLLFADDIVLLGKSEVELQTLLNTTADFAKKWKSKSKVLMVIGKRIAGYKLLP